jgi:hypothetical protein
MRTKHLPLGLGFLALLLTFGCQKTQTLPPAPIVNAGPSRTINLPINSFALDTIYLTGSATDSVSPIVGYEWSLISAPIDPFIYDNGSPTTEVSGFIDGTYVFQLMATAADGLTGVSTVTITVSAGEAPPTLTLHTLFPGTAYSPYEMMYLGNATEYNPGNSGSPELLAETWTINGTEVWGRSFFKFNLSPIPSATSVKSAILYLFSDTLPNNGDLIHANYGSTNDFWITRVSSTWDKTTGWNNFPSLDTAGEVHIPQTASAFANLAVDVTTMVNNMITNGNYGFEMHLNTEQIYNSRIFCSSLYSDSTRHPYMVVTY